MNKTIMAGILTIFIMAVGAALAQTNDTGNETSANATVNASANQAQSNDTAETNQSNQESSQNCFNTVADMPAACTGGVITQNTDLATFDNCRHVTCSNGNDSMEAKACEKPDEINPQFFELSVVNRTGSRISEICIGNTCVDGLNFARSPDFPICSNQASQVLQTSQASDAKVELSIMRWYPKGPDYVFICNASGFSPSSYTWFYGDGHKLIDIKNQNTYHVYGALGSYTVSCSATDGTNTASDTLVVNVNSLARPLHPLFGEGRTYSCISNQTNVAATCTCASQSEESASCKCESS